MVTHTRNLCSAINPSKVHTHSNEHTHTPWTHTRSSGQPFMLRRPGSSWGFGVLLKGTSVVVLKVERTLDIHSPHLQSLPARDSSPQPLGYESNSLTIRPRLSTIISQEQTDPTCWGHDIGPAGNTGEQLVRSSLKKKRKAPGQTGFSHFYEV